MYGVPNRADAASDPGAGPQQPLGRIAGGDAYHYLVGYRRGFQPFSLAVLRGLGPDFVGNGPKRKLAQRRQIADTKEIGQGLLDLVRLIDLALPEPRAEFLDRDIDINDFVGALEKAVGDGFAHGDASRAQDRVVQGLEVLDVDGSHNMNPGIEQVEHILESLSVLGAGNVCMGQLVDDADFGLASNDGVDVHLFQDDAAVFDLGAWNDHQIPDLGPRVGPPIGFNEADYEVKALAAQQVGVL